MKIAVIGCGVMGGYHARNYVDMADVSLVAVCDVNKAAAKELAKQYSTACYFNHKKLIKQENLDAVSIAVPTKLHKRIAIDFINAGISVLIEKPLAENVKEATALIKSAKKKSVVLAVGHIERFNPAVTKLQQLVEEKFFGEILSITVRRVGLFPTRVNDVNVITDLAVHDLDIVTWITNQMPEYVYARGSGALTKGRLDHAEIFLDYDKFGCFVQVNWITPIKIRQLSITGTKGHAELNYISQKLLVYDSIYKVKKPKGFKEFLITFAEPKKHKVKVKHEEPLKIEIKNFIDAVRGKTIPKVSGEEGLNAVKLASIVKESISKGKPIRVTSR